MRVIVIVTEDFNNYDFFEKEFFKSLSYYSKNDEFNNFEYVYIDNGEFCYIDELVRGNYWNYNKFDYITGKKRVYLSTLEEMIKYAIEDDNSLIIDFQEVFLTTKAKERLYKKYSKYINIYMIFYQNKGDEILCCNQELVLCNSDDNFDYMMCELCRNKYVLLQDIVDKFLLNTYKSIKYKCVNYVQGEFS